MTRKIRDSNGRFLAGRIVPINIANKISEVNKGKHMSPKTEIKKGMHISPKTEYKKGNVPWTKVGSVYDSISSPKIKIDGKSYLVSRINWIKNNFYRIPDGFVIHHLDLNPMNNHPSNLFLIDRTTHIKLHTAIIKNIKKEVY